MPLNSLKIVSNRPKCIKRVVLNLECLYCNGSTVIHGYSNAGKIRFRCKECKKTFQAEFINKAYHKDTNVKITNLLKEGVGIRSTSRLLRISATTVTKRILKIAEKIEKPKPEINQIYELDELRTYVGKKANLKWIAYAIRRDTKEVIDFNVGYRTNEMLKKVIGTLLNSDAKKIYTDRLVNYRYLIPETLHSTKLYGINHIERNNLTLRMHLKRLGRKTICYSKSMSVLTACMKIYFWG
jgi:insertion element IS1 protein InsB